MNSSIISIIDSANIKASTEFMNNVTERNVLNSIVAKTNSLDRFLTLISPAATKYMDVMAGEASRINNLRFGNAVHLYAPIYLSNYCANSCSYCGYRQESDITRASITLKEAESEAKILFTNGFRNILILTGEAPNKYSEDEIAKAIKIVHKTFPAVTVEIMPLSVEGYSKLVNAGCSGVTLYQECYNRKIYSEVHTKGPKSDYNYRLTALDRAAEAGVRRLNVGFLLGLAPWREEAIKLYLHLDYLQSKWWRQTTAVSFPRLRPFTGTYEPQFPVSVTELSQLMFALRLVFPDTVQVLSTRENAEFRDSITPLTVNQLRAGSGTDPGGSNNPDPGAEQFSISDDRTPDEVAQRLKEIGCDPAWKDWSSSFTGI